MDDITHYKFQPVVGKIILGNGEKVYIILTSHDGIMLLVPKESEYIIKKDID